MIDAAELKQTMLLAMSEHHSGNAEEAGRIVDAQLSALEAAGVRMVPVEASTEMEDAGTKVIMKAWGDGNRVYATDVYELMLAASPYAPRKDDSK